MADFCKQCSIELFGKDFKELANLTSEADEKEGKAAVVLCESCGPIQVDINGNCISSDCFEGGHKDIHRWL